MDENINYSETTFRMPQLPELYPVQLFTSYHNMIFCLPQFKPQQLHLDIKPWQNCVHIKVKLALETVQVCSHQGEAGP